MDEPLDGWGREGELPERTNIGPAGRSYIGPVRSTASFEMATGPEPDDYIEVEVEYHAELHCYDPSEGIEVEELSARIVGRELDDDETSALDLEVTAIEQFETQFPVAPEKGDYTRFDGSEWKVLGSAKLDGASRMLVLIESRRYPPYRQLMVDAVRFGRATAEWPCGGIHPEFVKGTRDDPPPPEGVWHPPQVRDLLTKR